MSSKEIAEKIIENKIEPGEFYILSEVLARAYIELKSANHDLLSALEECIPLLKAYDGDKWLETLNLVESAIKKAKGKL